MLIFFMQPVTIDRLHAQVIHELEWIDRIEKRRWRISKIAGKYNNPVIKMHLDHRRSENVRRVAKIHIERWREVDPFVVVLRSKESEYALEIFFRVENFCIRI